MKYEYIRVTAKQRATLTAALRHWQKTIQFNTLTKYVHWPPITIEERRVHFSVHAPLDVHDIDKLCDELARPLETPSNLEVTQELPDREKTQELFPLLP